MNQVVSKVRTRRTKRRAKQAEKAAVPKAPLWEGQGVGLGIGLLFWLAAVVLLGIDGILGRRTGLAFLLPFIGDAVFLLAGTLATGLFLAISRHDALQSNNRLVLLGLVALISMLGARTLLYMAEPMGLILPPIAVFLLPFALAPLLTTILIDGTAGLAVGFWCSLALALMAGRSLPLFLTGMIATVVAARTARRTRTRARVFRAGLVIGIAETLGVLVTTALSWDTPDVMLVVKQAFACVLSGFLSAMVVLLIIPLLEALFGITTDITLLELSDLGHPLLQRLAMEAPGTYHHSLVVASLAQAAADEIGANGLLARVCAYFHDIGKLVKPGFFSENIQYQRNPHDDLPPSMSTLVISSHVKEGLSLAMLHKLPSPILDAIREHHGTTLMSWFHHKARTGNNGSGEAGGPSGPPAGQARVNEDDFRYTGPKPSSPESAIICLADAVEATSRSMEKTTPGHLEGMVKEIANGRLEDGQLDRCELTLAELTRIRRSFVFTLTNMLHGRIPYPKDENRDKQQNKKAPSEQAEGKPADAAPHAAGG